jgi:twitching motility protein PilT
MGNDILDQLSAMVGVKNKDGSYNKLVKPLDSSQFTPTAEMRLQADAFRDEKQAPVFKRDEKFFVSQEAGYFVPNDINEILSTAYLNGASDIHIMVGAPPKMRLHGELLQMPYQILTPSISKNLLKPLLTEEQVPLFEESGDLDFAYSIEGACRFRVNMYKQRGSWGAVFRCLSNTIPNADDLGVPKAVQELCTKKRGLILVTGPTGSGKSTTLASLIKIINETRRENIITLEDPIEYVHKHKLSSVAQREIGLDSKSFAAGIRAALREDPDVILIGEMRDPETIATAVTAAETGHLVFSTLHTIGAAPTIDRIIDSFPEGQQAQIRIQLASVLEGVVSQQLVPTVYEDGRVAAFEVMLSNAAIRNLIREKKVEQMTSVMQTNRKLGMVTMDDYLSQLYYNGQITKERAIEFAVDKHSMTSKLM